VTTSIRASVLACVLFGVAGCGDDSTDVSLSGGLGAPDDDLYEDDDLPAGACRDTGTDTDPCDTEGTTAAAAPGAADPGAELDACQASADCMGGICAASFDPATLQRSAFACEFACIPLLDDRMWCSDDSSCCTSGAVCTRRGYCVLLEGESTTGSTME
jgi:hypothetical protein